jgi:hypothetical protein
MVSTVVTSVGDFRIAVGYNATNGEFQAEIDHVTASGGELHPDLSQCFQVRSANLFDLVRRVEEAIVALGGRILDRRGFPAAGDLEPL